MEKPSIIITMDYEVLGDGSGDVQQLVIEPTERLLNILSSRGIKMTVFFELEEFLAFRKYTKELITRLGYDPALMIEKQLERMIYEGHEIGLHIHPQWIGANYDGMSFNLFPKNQCLFDVYKSEEEMASYLKDRINILTTLVRKYDPSCEITCFRAGGLALRPEMLTLKVLQTLGIKADSSVVKGLYRIGEEINIDYRDAPYNKGFWRVNDNVCNEELKGGIIEFPVFSLMKPEYKKISINRINRKFFSIGHPARAVSGGFSKMAISRTPWGMVHHLFKKSPIKFDYCHMTTHEMLLSLNEAEKENGDMKKYPLTMIGHSKEFFNDKHFTRFLDVVIGSMQIKFRTIGETVKIIEDRGI